MFNICYLNDQDVLLFVDDRAQPNAQSVLYLRFFDAL